MKLGLHAYSLLLAGGLRGYQPDKRGPLTAEQLLKKAARLKCAGVQFARQQFAELDMVNLVNLGSRAKKLELTVHLSTNILSGKHLVEMIHNAHSMGAPQVTVGLSYLKGSVKDRQRTLENLLVDLGIAIKTAERYEVMLAIENGRHTAAADLVALIQAAESPWVRACFDMGNALTIPEDPVNSADLLGPYCVSGHLKDVQVYRTAGGVMLVNCPIGDGVVAVTEVLRVLKRHQPEMMLFLQTAAERVSVPVLDDDFLRQYPRITARALAGLLRHGTLDYDQDARSFPNERKTSEREVLKWEEDALKRSLKQALKLMGTESLTLSLG